MQGIAHPIGVGFKVVVALTSLASSSSSSAFVHYQPEQMHTTRSTSSFISISKNSRVSTSSITMTPPKDVCMGEDLDQITILGFGSLLSEKSAQLTFPTLKNFRLGRVPNHRRVFAHPASIFFKRWVNALFYI